MVPAALNLVPNPSFRRTTVGFFWFISSTVKKDGMRHALRLCYNVRSERQWWCVRSWGIGYVNGKKRAPFHHCVQATKPARICSSPTVFFAFIYFFSVGANVNPINWVVSAFWYGADTFKVHHSFAFERVKLFLPMRLFIQDQPLINKLFYFA